MTIPISQRIILFLALISYNLSIFSVSKIQESSLVERPFVVCIPSYNNQDYVGFNLLSVLTQKYSNYSVLYTDDKSSDDTSTLAKEIVEKLNQQDRFTLIQNNQRCMALGNIYRMVHKCDDRSIILMVDGDDWCKHANVLATLNKYYANPEIWFTYGDVYTTSEGKLHGCRPYEPIIINNNAYRSTIQLFFHPRTFYAWLFKKIKLKDLLYEGGFFTMASDIAFTFPMLEMTGGRFTYIDEFLYVYNQMTPINDYKTNRDLQVHYDNYIRKLRRYKKLAQAPSFEKQQGKPTTISAIIVSNDSPDKLKQYLTWVQIIPNISKSYIFYTASNKKNENSYHNLQKDYPQVIFFEKTNSIALHLQQLIKENLITTDLCLVSNDKDYMLDLNHAIALFKQTKAMVVTYAYSSIDTPLVESELTHASYFNENLYTFQLGWQPMLYTPYISYAQLFRTKKLKRYKNELSTLLTDNLQLTPIVQNGQLTTEQLQTLPQNRNKIRIEAGILKLD